MSDFYFDIETYTKGEKVDLKNDEIITIQYQPLDMKTGQTKGNLTILKAWESSEKDILQKFYQIFKPEDRWAFVPCGCYLGNFDLPKLYYRWRSIGITVDSSNLFFEHPQFDLKCLLVTLNGGVLSGAKLEKFAGKSQSGGDIKALYESKNFDSIIKYVEEEARCYINLYSWLVKRMPEIWNDEYKCL